MIERQQVDKVEGQCYIVGRLHNDLENVPKVEHFLPATLDEVGVVMPIPPTAPILDVPPAAGVENDEFVGPPLGVTTTGFVEPAIGLTAPLRLPDKIVLDEFRC